MRSDRLRLRILAGLATTAGLLCCALTALAADTPAAPAIAANAIHDAPPERGEQKVERLHHEDKGSSIDELRVGGETRSVKVQPKYDVPGYQIVPTDGTQRPAIPGEVGSPSVWNLKIF